MSGQISEHMKLLFNKYCIIFEVSQVIEPILEFYDWGLRNPDEEIKQRQQQINFLLENYLKRVFLINKRIMQRIRNMSIGRDQVSIRRRTFDAQDGRNIDNPFGTNGTDVQGANPVIEMVDRLKILKKVKAVKRRSFERYETEDGDEFFVELGTEESVWDLPEDGKVVG